MIVLLNASLPVTRIVDEGGVSTEVHGAFALASSGEPLLDGFKAIYGDIGLTVLGIAALTGLIASFHTILYAQGRQVYSLSRAGYFPSALSVTHSSNRTPHVAMIAGSIVGLAIMFIIWYSQGAEQGGATISSILLNMAVFGAMLSYILQATSFILLRKNHPNIERPYRSPFGIPGAVATIVIGLVTLLYQIQDRNFFYGVFWVAVWFAVAIIYFGLVGRHRLILSPEEEFAMSHRAGA
jgi:ethanolamine permease